MVNVKVVQREIHLRAIGRVERTTTSGNPEVVAELAALGLGVAVLPESYARTRDDLHLLRLGRPTLRARVGVAWRPDGRLSAAADAVVTLWQNQSPASSGGHA